MATDATGTPTSLGIPKFNTSADAPSGLGFNAAMDAIDALIKIPYGTTLPASPADGQQAILVDSTTNPSYQWRFRYNAGSASGFKWEFTGGTRKVVGPSGSLSTTTTGFTDLTSGPIIALPRAGDYAVLAGITGATTAQTATFFGQARIVVGAQTSAELMQLGATTVFSTASMSLQRNFTNVSASDQVKLQVQNDRAAAGTMQWTLGWFDIVPLRVI